MQGTMYRLTVLKRLLQAAILKIAEINVFPWSEFVGFWVYCTMGCYCSYNAGDVFVPISSRFSGNRTKTAGNNEMKEAGG